ncbi:two component diguanylate cyclase [Oceanicola granulosus HTCC2516]|uniref:diguanylate cyclase n=1 Tax=Oceanicola granulosus (strain ATCC BAA-861 / DSM 15982 / KCTC 12143 / HTCC2516) TaxID=314256 RepID=Q2C9S2_OCEGH|nr:diguanylate cyclase [Oceanicola granulosus]EAR49428.1 two component diguanylate cyclase [Oceanicola granulosus HTCC2516]
MAANILVVDPSATSRIVLKVKLTAANYRVTLAATPAEARTRIAEGRPDLVLAGLSAAQQEALAACAGLRAAAAGRPMPLVVLGPFERPDDRLAVLAAGADDVLGLPAHDVLLLAKIRSHLRERDAEAELRLREDAARALGFAEPETTFRHAGRVALVVPPGREGLERGRAISAVLPGGCAQLSPDEALAPSAGPAAPLHELFIIDASRFTGADASSELFRLVTELRARAETRHAAQLVILPQGAEGMSAMVLDLGANDLVTHDVGLEELAHRVRTLLQCKRQRDGLRATLRDGLLAAVTDPLTGLHNRRYALPHLEHMAQTACAQGSGLALMVLDVDHFKTINDRWGHPSGDAVLCEIARRLRDNVRPGDLLARIGGEEFVVAMADVSDGLARHTAERLCNVIEEAPFPLPGRTTALQVTVSIGVAMAEGMTTSEELFNSADAALYRAKTAGRNTVSLSASAASAA